MNLLLMIVVAIASLFAALFWGERQKTKFTKVKLDELDNSLQSLQKSLRDNEEIQKAGDAAKEEILHGKKTGDNPYNSTLD